MCLLLEVINFIYLFPFLILLLIYSLLLLKCFLLYWIALIIILNIVRVYNLQ